MSCVKLDPVVPTFVDHTFSRLAILLHELVQNRRIGSISLFKEWKLILDA
eukprot:XP_001709258.1 Hypothetical protein GL50803_38886 [Giardia lamblia ATCC 50803]